MQRALWRFFGLIALAASGFLAGCAGSCLGCGGDGNPGGDGGGGGGTPPPVGTPPPAVVLQSFAYVVTNGGDAVNVFRIEDSGELTSVDSVSAGENVRFLAIHPSNRFAYAVNRSDDDISVYTLDPATGRLSNRTDVATGRSPWLIRIHPSGQFAYVTNTDDGTVSIFTVDAATGLLAPHPAGPVAVGAGPNGLMIDPSGSFLFVASGDGVRSYAIAASGALGEIDTIPTARTLTDIALAPSGGLLYTVANDGTVSRHAITDTGRLGAGAESAVGTVGDQTIHIEPRGRFAYLTNRADSSVSAFGLHPDTGELLPANTVSPGISPRAVAMGPTGQFLYATSRVEGTVSRYSVDQTSGALQAVGTPLELGNGILGITILPASGL